MKKSQLFNLIYYSQLPLVTMAVVLTASISAVLTYQISWSSVALVGLSTYFSYSLDNLFDWKKDQARYQNIQKTIEGYQKISYGLLALSAAGIVLLTFESGAELKIGLLLLGSAMAMGTFRFSSYRSGDKPATLTAFLLNRIFIALVWAVVCVFLPLWAVQGQVNGRFWRTFIYMCQLIFVYAVLWKYEKSHPETQTAIENSRLFTWLKIISLVAVGQVIVDAATGLFPPLNLVNMLPPLVSLMGVQIIQKNPSNLRAKIAWLTLALAVVTSLSAILHLIQF